MNEVIANYGMPLIPSGWPPGYEVQLRPEGSPTTHQLTSPGGRIELFNTVPYHGLEQTRLNTWQDYLRENPGALSVPSTQRVAGVYGPPIRTRSNYYKYIGLSPDARRWREIAEELGVPFIETGK